MIYCNYFFLFLALLGEGGNKMNFGIMPGVFAVFFVTGKISRVVVEICVS